LPFLAITFPVSPTTDESRAPGCNAEFPMNFKWGKGGTRLNSMEQHHKWIRNRKQGSISVAWWQPHCNSASIALIPRVPNSSLDRASLGPEFGFPTQQQQTVVGMCVWTPNTSVGPWCYWYISSRASFLPNEISAYRNCKLLLHDHIFWKELHDHIYALFLTRNHIYTPIPE
jgi:hypothetical protein